MARREESMAEQQAPLTEERLAEIERDAQYILDNPGWFSREAKVCATEVMRRLRTPQPVPTEAVALARQVIEVHGWENRPVMFQLASARSLAAAVIEMAERVRVLEEQNSDLLHALQGPHSQIKRNMPIRLTPAQKISCAMCTTGQIPTEGDMLQALPGVRMGVPRETYDTANWHRDYGV
jgi:hypothetical protein